MEAGKELIRGWQPQPNTRGTFEIIYDCVCTIVLCSWSCLCLNIPRAGASRQHVLALKLQWQIFTIFFPELSLSLAAEQWESANQAVEKFSDLGYREHWSMQHAFFADMGGILLQTPDFPAFPVDSQQLAYLVERQYLAMPHLSHTEIADKNKTDGFSRFLAVLQLSWFSIQCVGRWIQGIGLSTLELSTVAFILCTLNMYFFWHFKPCGMQSRITLYTDKSLAAVLGDAEIQEVIAELDRPEPQVEIEAKILQTNRDTARALGVQWGLNGRVAPDLGNTTGAAFPNRGTVGGRVTQQGPVTQGPLGQLQLTQTATTDAGTIDATTSPDGRYLYVQAGVAGTVDEYQVGFGGSLTQIGTVTVSGGVGQEGIAAS